MTACSVKVFVEFHEHVNEKALLGYVPGYRDLNSRVHILIASGKVVGRTLCNLGQQGTPYERGTLSDGALPCAQCFDKALTVQFRHRRKAEEQPGRL